MHVRQDSVQYNTHALWTCSISLYGSSVGGTWREGGSFAKGPEGYDRKAVRTCLSLHGGSVGQPGMGSSTGDFQIWLKGALRVESLSLLLSLSLGALCRELGGRPPCWEP